MPPVRSAPPRTPVQTPPIASAPEPAAHVEPQHPRADASREPGATDPIGALRAAFPSSMASTALDQLRVARIEATEIELVGPMGAIAVFRARIDDVSRALSGALGRRLRAVLTPESAPIEGPDSRGGSDSSVTMEAAKEHPLVVAARKAFDADIVRVEPLSKRPVTPEPNT
ncbi:MAG: hypothetical protein KF902_14355 [Phycisphaeraceae bacterium]|nr:hypothetical protein [Phycisphaeraceae bacterium]